MDGLKSVVNRYHSLMDSLNDAEFNLLSEQILDLRRVMRPGFKRMNWNALGSYILLRPYYHSIASVQIIDFDVSVCMNY